MIRLKTLFFAILILTTSLVVTIDSLAVMSVDLGTEFMKIAVVKPGIPMEIALNKWVLLGCLVSLLLIHFYRESRRKTPVIVAIKGKDREFGEAAVSRVRNILMMEIFPAEIIFVI